jgi:hypothetical protein
MNLNKQLSCKSFIKYNNLENTTMISPKWAVLMAAFALVGTITVPSTAFAQVDESQNAEVDIERNNEISQSIEQSQEACTNEAQVSISDDDEEQEGGVNSASVSQSNECDVTQTQTATNNAAIVDDSENTFDVQQAIITGSCPAQFENCLNIADVFPSNWCDLFQSQSLQDFCNENDLG